MTVQPTRDQLEAELDSWMARAYEAEKRAWQAEARIRAVCDVLDEPDAMIGTRLHVTVDRICRALDGER